MMKNTPLNNAVAARRRVTAAVLLGSAIVAQAIPAHAQEASSAAAAPQLAITKSPTAAADNLQTPKVEVFRSAPTLPHGATPETEAAKPVTAAVTGPVGPASAAVLAKVAEEDVPDVLTPNLRPWPLAYIEPVPLNALYFTLPTARDARIMLPGYASDEVDRVRFTVNRYVTDNIGNAAQARGRQMEAFQTWVANYDKQKAELPKDPWAAYQFSKEALPVVKAFREKVAAQAEPSLNRMIKDVNGAVAQITPVMEATSSYELKLQWYNVLVQLKEGVTLYQARVAEADRPLLDAIAAFENANPPVARPLGPAPRPKSAATVVANAVLTEGEAVVIAPREPAKPIPVEPPPSQTGGIVVMFGIAAAVIGLFMKLRKRVARTGATKKD